jgi:hypothetical protein
MAAVLLLPLLFLLCFSPRIWGVGLSGGRWQGIHRELGYFDGLPIFEGCEVVVTDQPETISPTQVLDPVDVEYSDNNVFEEEGDINVEQDATVVQGEDGDYDDVDVDVESPASQINFGGSSSASLQADTGLTRGMWVAHGILLALAWGLFAPLAIGSAYLRKMKFLQKDALWLCIHFYLSFGCASFTFFGFVFGVLAANQQGDETHFQKDTHHKAGLTIFILVIVQALLGHFRPSNAPAKGKDDGDREPVNSIEDQKSLNDTMEFDDPDGERSDGSPPPPPPSSPTIQSSSKVTKIRQYWEYFHRFLGMTLLGLAWYNCTTGIVLQSEKYGEDEEMLTNIFWGITGSIAALIFFVGYVLRLQ